MKGGGALLLSLRLADLFLEHVHLALERALQLVVGRPLDGLLERHESRRRARAQAVARDARLYGAFGPVDGRAATRLRARLLSSVPESVGRKLLRMVFDYDAYAVEV